MAPCRCINGLRCHVDIYIAIGREVYNKLFDGYHCYIFFWILGKLITIVISIKLEIQIICSLRLVEYCSAQRIFCFTLGTIDFYAFINSIVTCICLLKRTVLLPVICYFIKALVIYTCFCSVLYIIFESDAIARNLVTFRHGNLEKTFHKASNDKLTCRFVDNHVASVRTQKSIGIHVFRVADEELYRRLVVPPHGFPTCNESKLNVFSQTCNESTCLS